MTTPIGSATWPAASTGPQRCVPTAWLKLRDSAQRFARESLREATTWLTIRANLVCVMRGAKGYNETDEGEWIMLRR